MDLAAFDRWAARGGPLQRSAPRAKLVGAALALAAVATSRAPLAIAAVGLAWLAALALSGVPARAVLLWASYAGTFAALYALASWEGDWREALTLVGKAIAAAVVVIGVSATTPYPRIFQALRPGVPGVLVDAFALTYRSLYLLLERWDRLRSALRLRGGLDWRHPRRALGGLGLALGVMVLGALDRSEALYDAMLLRGYQGAIAAPERWRAGWPDLLPLGLGAAGLGLVCLPAVQAGAAAIALAAVVAGEVHRRWPM